MDMPQSGQSFWLLSTDRAGSVLAAQAATLLHERAHCAYGYHQADAGPSAGFNGEWLAGLASGYLLGNGYRLYSPVLMRFLSADGSSPFAEGGFNAYGYCEGDPVNRADPTGHGFSWTGVLKRIGVMKRTGQHQRKAEIGKRIHRDAEADKPLRLSRQLAADNNYKDQQIADQRNVIAKQDDQLNANGQEIARLQNELEVSGAQVSVLRAALGELQGVNSTMLTVLGYSAQSVKTIIHADLARLGRNVIRRGRGTRAQTR